MCPMDPAFMSPPPKDWTPQPGERVRLLFGGEIHEVVITQLLDGPGGSGYVVAGDELLLPVACGREAIRPLSNGRKTE